MKDNNSVYKKLDLKQLAIKLLINSIYGAFGNKWFYFFNTDIAQSITLQGQDLIKFTIKAVNFYFKERWHLDTELHDYLGISKYKIEKVNGDTAIYTDTDSIYVQFGSAMRSIKGMPYLSEEAQLKMCIKIDDFRLSGYFKKCFSKYSSFFNTKNRQNFELENLSIKGLWLKKKNYALKISYEPNSNFSLLRDAEISKEYEVFKGLEMIKSSYPIWARQHLEKLTKLILDKGYSLNIEEDILPKLKAIKKEIKLKHIEDLAFNFNCRVYTKYVKSEKNLELLKGIPIYARAASYYNHLLITNKLLGKYSKIMEGNKIKYYHPSENKHEFDIFAYAPGAFPDEIALPMDYDKQFFALIVEPINRQLKALGMNELNVFLNRNVEMVKTGTRKILTDEQMYPLYVINTKTLEYQEIPEKFWKIIGTPSAKVPDDGFNEYIGIISKYGLDTKIVPNSKLETFRKRTAKRLGIELMEDIDVTVQTKMDI
jgi:DNA polymerase elongation subunit (family B)